MVWKQSKNPKKYKYKEWVSNWLLIIKNLDKHREKHRKLNTKWDSLNQL